MPAILKEDNQRAVNETRDKYNTSSC